MLRGDRPTDSRDSHCFQEDTQNHCHMRRLTQAGDFVPANGHLPSYKAEIAMISDPEAQQVRRRGQRPYRPSISLFHQNRSGGGWDRIPEQRIPSR